MVDMIVVNVPLYFNMILGHDYFNAMMLWSILSFK
jgi:hypothetical protein